MSFYTSLNGLRNSQMDLGIVAHNIANSETTGFKKGRAEFSDLVTGSAYTNPKQGIGATIEGVSQNFSLGPIEQTGNALDLALNGDGFFTTIAPKTGQTLFTRNGNFALSADGYISDGDGNRLQVLSTDPTGLVTSTVPFSAVVPLTSASGSDFTSMQINQDGQVIAAFADGSNEIVGTLSLANFVSTSGLIQAGSSNWYASGISGPPKYGAPGTANFGTILTGALERSNVDIAEELVGLITAQRNFQANAKAIDTASQISQTIINLRT